MLGWNSGGCKHIIRKSSKPCTVKQTSNLQDGFDGSAIRGIKRMDAGGRVFNQLCFKCAIKLLNLIKFLIQSKSLDILCILIFKNKMLKQSRYNIQKKGRTRHINARKMHSRKPPPPLHFRQTKKNSKIAQIKLIWT